MNRAALSFIVAAVVTSPLARRVALADTPDPAAAEAVFRQGRASADAGDYPRACASFAESLRLEPAPGTLFNLADCEEHVGRLASARGHFLRVERVLPAADERHGIARERAAALSLRVPWLVVTLASGAPSGARVFRDDVELDDARIAVPLPVDPGSHSVLVVAPGRESRTTTSVAVEGETTRVVAAPGPSSGPLVAHEASPATRAHTAAWFVGAAGIASLGVGTYFGARALAERSLSDVGCAGDVCGSVLGRDAYESARSDAVAADVALGVGIVALAVSGYLLLRTQGDSSARTALQLTGSGVRGAW
jgi:hypothetical protein